MQISDKIPNDLRIICVGPLRNTRRPPNHRYGILCNDIRISEGQGGEILATLGNEITKFHNDTSNAMKGGSREVFGGDRANVSGSLLLFAVLKMYGYVRATSASQV